MPRTSEGKKRDTAKARTIASQTKTRSSSKSNSAVSPPSTIPKKAPLPKPRPAYKNAKKQAPDVEESDLGNEGLIDAATALILMGGSGQGLGSKGMTGQSDMNINGVVEVGADDDETEDEDEILEEAGEEEA